jgi:hypothetical protein
MRKTKLITIVLISLLALSTIQMMSAKALETEVTAIATTAESANLLPSTALSNSEISAAWPNLPTAKELYQEGYCITVDLRYSGKDISNLDSAKADTEMPSADALSWITNCTRDEINWRDGTIIKTANIWLQYNSSIWVMVPQKYLNQSSIQPPDEQTDLAPQAGTWAIGLYTDPNDIAHGAPVMGAVTYGEYPTSTWTSTDSNKYLGTDLLSICDTNSYEYQWAMVTRPTVGRYLSINIWDSSGHVTPYSFSCPGGSVQGQLYSLFIRYYEPLSRWEFFWNQQFVFSYGSSASRITVGNQPNVCVESNEMGQSYFNSFRTRIGGTYYSGGTTYTLPAIGFLYNGQWRPVNPGDPVPAAYSYMGGTVMPSWPGVGVGTTNPYALGWSNWGTAWAYPEQMLVGYGYQMPYQGKPLWPHQN